MRCQVYQCIELTSNTNIVVSVKLQRVERAKLTFEQHSNNLKHSYWHFFATEIHFFLKLFSNGFIDVKLLFFDIF